MLPSGQADEKNAARKGAYCFWRDISLPLELRYEKGIGKT